MDSDICPMIPLRCTACKQARHYEYNKSELRNSTAFNASRHLGIPRRHTCTCSSSCKHLAAIKNTSHRHSSQLLVTLVIVMLGVICQSSYAAAGTSYYPPSYNAALQQPISVTADGTCGMNGSMSYCRSFSDPSSVTSCWVGECTLACPWGDSLPFSIHAFDRVASGWGDCVALNDTVDGPPVPGANLVHFRGSGTDTCYLTLTPEWFLPISIQGSWSITITAWVRAMVAGRPR